MAVLPYLIPTARYKRAVKVGNKVTFAADDIVEDIGRITDVFWSIDEVGSNRVTSVTELTEFYLQVRTADISTTVSVMIDTDLLPSDMKEGIVDRIYAIPITQDPVTKLGTGFVKYNVNEDHDEMSIRNTTWQNVTPTRAANTLYTNNTEYSIWVTVTVHASHAISGARSIMYVNDVAIGYAATDVGPGGYGVIPITVCVAPGETYRFVPRSGDYVECWAERRPE